jgi:undecaprenyl pyrophosphate phosphatase UppP
MSELTRRRFLHTSALGVAALGAAATLPGCSGSGTDSASAALTGTATTSALNPSFTAPVVAVIRDFSTGEIAVYQGNREIRYHDQNVLQSIIKAAS